MDLYIESNGQRIGMIKQKLFQLGSHFNVEDLNGNMVCYAQTRFTALGVEYDVFDNYGQRIGTVIEQIIKSMFNFSIIYTVYDAFGNPVAKTKQYEVVKTHV